MLAVVPLGRGGPALALLQIKLPIYDLAGLELADHSNDRAQPLGRCWASALRRLIRYGKGRGIAKPAGLPAITLLSSLRPPGRYQYAGRTPLRAPAAACSTRRCFVAVPVPLRRPTRALQYYCSR